MSAPLDDDDRVVPLAARRKAKTAPKLKADTDVLTEDSAALEFARQFEGYLLYDHDAGAWFVWADAYWRRERTGLAYEWARTLIRDLSAEIEKASARYAVRKTSFASGVEKFARSSRTFATTSDGWNPDPYKLGTPGGVVDLRTGKLTTPNPTDKITKLTAVPPSPAAACPLWRQFLIEATNGDVGLIRFLQQMCGYALTGDVSEHALFFVHGSGGNGKGVFLNTTSKILGTYAATSSMDTFTASTGDKHPTELAALHGSRLVTASETEEGRQWAEARIKQLTGGDRIAARFMRQDFFEFDPTFKIVVVGNHRPVLRNVDDALRRRLSFIPFDHKPASPDRELEDKLRAEWPGIMRWMIDGCLDWQANGLLRPDVVKDATASYFGDQDIMEQWLEEMCDADPGNDYKSATSAELFSSWREYSTKAGEKLMSQKSFADALQKRGFVRHKGSFGVRTFKGVRLKPTQANGRYDFEGHII